MNLKLLLFLLCIFPLGRWSLVSAEAGRGEAIFLGQSIDLSFIPEDAYFFVDFDNDGLGRRMASFVPDFRDPTNSAEKKWYFGTKVRVPTGKDAVTYSLVVVGSQNRYLFVPPQTIDLNTANETLWSVDALKDRILTRKSTLASWEVQTRAQADSLSRIRSDAEVIGKLSRIVEVREEIERLKSEMQSLEKHVERMKRSLTLATSRPPPKNAVGRELELTKHLSALAEAAKDAESGKFERKGSAQAELSHKLALIESTRYDDLEALQSELIRVRNERERLKG